MVVVGPIVLALAACDAPPAVFGDVLPDERLILREDELLPRGISDIPSEWATWVLQEAQATNRRHTELLLLLEAVTVLPANYRDRRNETAVVWGPWIVDDVAQRLWVEQGNPSYAWAIERQTVDPDRVRFDDEAWVQDLSGTIDVTGDGTSLGGAFVLDVDEVGLGVVDAALEAFGEVPTGELPVSFDDGPVGRVALRYTANRDGAALTTWADLGENSTVPNDGGVTFVHEPAAGGTARAVVETDVDGDGTVEPAEVVVQWAASGGGRADVTALQGGTTLVECWGADHAPTYRSSGELGTEADCGLPE